MSATGTGVRSIAFVTTGIHDDERRRGLEKTLQTFEYGEQLGYDGAWVRERRLEHRASSAAALLAAAAPRTRRIELGGVVIAIDHESPFRLAEDLSAADVLSRGRLQVGVGAGTLPLVDPVGDHVRDDDRQQDELSYARVRRLREALRGDVDTGMDSVVDAPEDLARPPLHPHSPGLATRLWLDVGSVRSARWAAENGLHLVTGSVVSVPGAEDLSSAQLQLRAAYEAALPRGTSRRVAVSRVIIPTDSAEEEARERYRRYAESRSRRTRVARGDEERRFAADLVGSSAEILDTLAHDLFLRAAGQLPVELRLELPSALSVADHRQILTDFRERIAPGLGWRTRDDMRIVIRRARREEYRRVGELTHAAYARDYRIGEDYGHQLLHPEEREAEYEIWVAEDSASGELLGTVSTLRQFPESRGRAREGELYFRLLAVAPEARRRGVGAQLTTFTVELARQRGLHTVSLNSGQDMVGAHALYRSLGFQRIRERDAQIGEPPSTRTLYTFTRPADV